MEIRIAQIIGEYEGKKSMLNTCYEEMRNMLPVNEAGETIAESILNLNKWYERCQKEILNEMVKKINEIYKNKK